MHTNDSTSERLLYSVLRVIANEPDPVTADQAADLVDEQADTLPVYDPAPAAVQTVITSLRDSNAVEPVIIKEDDVLTLAYRVTDTGKQWVADLGDRLDR